MTKEKTIRVLVDFLNHPDKFGCAISYIRREGYGHRFGMIMAGYAAVADIEVGEACNHPTLGVVCVRRKSGKRFTVHDGNKEHLVEARECKKIRV